MTDSRELVAVVADAIAQFVRPRQWAEEVAVKAVTVALRTLVDEHFPHDNVDYHYACEGLVGGVADALRELDGAS